MFLMYNTYSTDHKQLNIYSRECASRTCGHAYSARERKYYARSCARASCECRACAYIMSGSTIRVHTGLIDHRTRLLTLTRMHSYTTHEYSYATRECCIDRSRALAPPSRVMRKQALSCL